MIYVTIMFFFCFFFLIELSRIYLISLRYLFDYSEENIEIIFSH